MEATRNISATRFAGYNQYLTGWCKLCTHISIHVHKDDGDSATPSHRP